MHHPLEQLRAYHPAFHYDSCHVTWAESLTIEWTFRTEPKISFKPKIKIQLPKGSQNYDRKYIEYLATQLGLVEMLSYWKAACSPNIFIRALPINQNEIAWWQDLFLHGMSEFYFKNNINPLAKDFLTFYTLSGNEQSGSARADLQGELVLVGGGKDSALTLELLSTLPGEKRNVLILNPIASAIDSAKAAGFTSPIIVERSIDGKLLDLNRQGYLNGHTPFSAYLAFLGIIIAELYGFKYVIAANEASADEGNTIRNGLTINHQYSKSSRFEQLFREYAQASLKNNAHYFSFIRPLYDLQVAKLFSKCKTQLAVFKSCNVGQKENRWCGKCPKCAFVYLSLFPFLSEVELAQIFTDNYFEHAEIIAEIKNLIGLGQHKPLECVGTTAEAQAALHLTLEKYAQNNQTAPLPLKELHHSLLERYGTPNISDIMPHWGNDSGLPAEYKSVLQKALAC